MQQILQSYQRRLTNLSGNNRSLLLLRLMAHQFIDLNDFDFLDLKPSFRIIEELLAQKPEIGLIPNTDSRDAESNKLAGRLRKIQRTDRFIFDESGARDLFIGWPFVQGKFNDGTLVNAPLLFFPVTLSLENNAWSLVPRGDVNISLNKSLILAYAHYNGVEVDEDLVEYSFDDFDGDATVFRNALYELLGESVLEIKFGHELFADKLERFQPHTRLELEKDLEQGQLSLNPQAVLGIFPQADSYLVPDYDFLLEKARWESLDNFFAEKAQNDQNEIGENFDAYRYFLDKVKEEETYTPYRLDAFQENAIKAVKKGNSLVVQGPPGTGKSQLICNLISDYVARGRKVLVVSQKRAALDVVYNRLHEHKITDFVALVHDFKNDRKEIYDKINSQIERLGEYKRSNNNLDAIQLDRSFRQASRSIDDITETLDEYKTALFDESECGLSVKELYLTSDPELPAVSLTQEYSTLDFHVVDDFVKNLERYLTYAGRFDHPGHPWSERVDFSELTISDLKQIMGYLDEIPKVAKELTRKLSEIIGEKVDYDACRTLAENLDRLQELSKLLSSEEIFRYFRPMVESVNQDSDVLWLQNTHSLIKKCFQDEGVEKTIASGEMGEIQTILKKRSDAKKTFVQSIKWRFSKEKMRLARVLVANGLRDDKEGLRVLTSRIDNRMNLQHQMTKLKEADWVHELPESMEEEEIALWFVKVEQALHSKLLFARFANFKEYFPLKNTSAKEFRNKIKVIRGALKDLPRQRQNWNQYILPRQIDLLLADEDFLKSLKNSLRRDFDAICEQDKLKGNFSEAELGAVDKLLELEIEDKNELLTILDNSLRLAWIDHIESKYPILRSVSTLQFDQLANDLQTAMEEKAEASTEILLQKAREKTYEPVEYNRLNNMVTYRDLQHQVTKKRMIWPVRRLLTHFSDELFDLIPCWMASPESVSAIFPMENLFDLVVFDEASQCFAEKGLPAIYRGKQVVVAGDDQQLQPNDLYRVRWEEGETEEMALEVDSLLNLTKKYLMEVDLRGHYRSQSLDLIDFSNQYFYKGKLQLLPHFDKVNDGTPGIDFVKVDGVWEKQRNRPEAGQVLSMVHKLTKEHPEKSIGVVTFNVTQQQLIAELFDESPEPLPEHIFVKNIENVQGDERDIIIFSTAYAPDKKGRVVLQFGSLNLAGGENRLNVAVTRAREKVIVVSSLEPHQLDVSKTKNEGPRLLRKYLEYAKEVSEKKFVPSSNETIEFGQHWYLKNKLSAWESEYGAEFSSELPFADITVRQNGAYQGLMLTDDDQFYNGVSVKDTFVYKPGLLQQKQWKHLFFHSRGFWLDKDKVREKMGRFLEG